MSFSCAAVHAQPLLTAGPPDPGGDCDPYTMPSPTAVVTDLDATLVWSDGVAVETNLCSEIV